MTTKAAVIASAALLAACATPAPAPEASAFSQAPLRNRIRVVLEAPPAQVWSLVGDLARLPEYSAGLERVEVHAGPDGRPSGYTCRFRPMAEGEASVVHRERLAWYEPDRGWASTGMEPVDAFGVSDGVHLVTLEPADQGTLLTWAVHYHAADLPTYQASLDEALADIAQRLVARFGGRLVDRHGAAAG